jgi:hypothetical protein
MPRVLLPYALQCPSIGLILTLNL